jgi:prophage regulatory protein
MQEAKKLARLPRVLEIVGGSRSWVYLEIANGRFPKPIKIGTRSSAWIEEEIFNWIEQKIKQSRHTGDATHA